jgi:hypothetical protein
MRGRATGGLAESACQHPLERCSVVGFKAAKLGVKQFRSWDYHDIEPGGACVSAEDRPNQPLSPIATDRTTQFPGGGDAQSRQVLAVRAGKHGQEPAAGPNASLVNPLELGPPANPLGPRESL